MATSVALRFSSDLCEELLWLILSFISLHRREEGLVRPRFVVGEEEDLAAENPLDIGQVRHPSGCKAAFHAAAQAAAPSAAQHEAHEGQGQLLRPRLQGRVRHLQNFQ